MPGVVRIATVAVSLAFGIAGGLTAQSTPTAAQSVRTVQAAAAAGEIDLDGQLDETAWTQVEPITGFIQGEPIEGVPAENDTEVRVLYDDEAIYVGARMLDRNPATIGRHLTRRDETRGSYDYFEASFDPNLDRRTAYTFRVSAAGVQADIYRFDDTEEDDSWDAVWESAVSYHEWGWAVEMRIPLSQIRFRPASEPQTWGVNFVRRKLSTNEQSYFMLESREREAGVSVYGRLTGLDLSERVRNLEIQPYVLTRTRTGPAEPGNPFFDGSDYGIRAGGDLRYGLASTFVLDATVLPDFGQVEVDPAVINLTAFETFFPERRPFFTRDARLFDFQLSGRESQLFYSRRIGRSPQGEAPEGADFEDVPNETDILGAAKITGRTSDGLGLGALVALTAEEEGRAYFADRNDVSTFVAEPAAAYGVIRLQQDLRNGASQVGFIGTALRRDLPDDGSFDLLTSEAFAGGVDFEHSWADRTWMLSGFYAASRIAGAPEAMVRVQRSSLHYFQRPDADYIEVDSSATSMMGAAWELEFERLSGRWTGGMWIGQRTPGFHPSDVGFEQEGEQLDAGVRVEYQDITPGRLFRDYRLNAFVFGNWRHSALDDPFSWDRWGRSQKDGFVSVDAEVSFLNYWGLNLSLNYNPELLDDRATRGGPLMLSPASRGFELRGHTDRRRRLGFEPSFSYESGTRGAERFDAGLEVSWRPIPSLELEVSPEYEWEHDPAQYVATMDDAGFEPTYGARYLFSDLDLRTVSLETRLNWIFSPTLSLQLYAQPLLSAGDYLTFKQLSDSESYEFEVFEEGNATPIGGNVICSGGRTCALGGQRYVDFDDDAAADFSFDDQDFNLRSLRGNAVLRWEYRPGSTIFLVWQQNRTEELGRGDFSFGRDAEALLSAPADNVLILKVNYWLGL